MGWGTGILFMLAAKAGAVRVMGVDMSSIDDSVMEVVAGNGLEEGVTISGGSWRRSSCPKV